MLVSYRRFGFSKLPSELQHEFIKHVAQRRPFTGATYLRSHENPLVRPSLKYLSICGGSRQVLVNQSTVIIKLNSTHYS
jgi:hypothetical protein